MFRHPVPGLWRQHGRCTKYFCSWAETLNNASVRVSWAETMNKLISTLPNQQKKVSPVGSNGFSFLLVLPPRGKSTLPNNKRKFLQLAQMGGSSKIKSEPPTRSCLIQAGASLSSDLAPLACVCVTNTPKSQKNVSPVGSNGFSFLLVLPPPRGKPTLPNNKMSCCALV